MKFLQSWKGSSDLKTYNVFLTKDARNNLKEIFAYISDILMEPRAAKRIQKSILQSITSLETMPLRHPLIGDEPYKNYGVRIQTAENYLVFYTVDEIGSSVNILNVVYCRRDWKI